MDKIMENPIHKTHRNIPRIKYLFLLIVILMSISLVTSLEFDNTKSFDEKVGDYGKVEIKDWFGLRKLETLELKTNTEECSLGRFCSATQEIIMYQDGKLIDRIRFMVKQKDGSWKRGRIDSYSILVNGKKYKFEEVEGSSEGIKYNLTLKGRIDWEQIVDWQITAQGKLIGDWAIWSGVDRPV